MAHTTYGPLSLERMFGAVRDVQGRMNRAKTVLETAGIPYAVVGGLAVAAWVEKADASGIRNTPDVNILLRRIDLSRATAALEQAGFVHQFAKSFDAFLDGANSTLRSSVKVLFAGERFRKDNLLAAPSLKETEPIESDELGRFQVVSLVPLVRMKLDAYRRIDRVHLRDMIEIELIDETWPARFIPVLGERLQALLDDPDG